MPISFFNRLLDKPKANTQSLHLLWAVPPSSFVINKAYNLVLPARAFLGAINLALTADYQTSALPSGFTSATDSPSGAASRIADWQEYFGYYKGYNDRDPNYWGFLILQNWCNSGAWHSGNSLLRHPGDAIGSYISTPFTASGRAAWTPLSTAFASGLKVQLDTRSGIYFETLAYPAYMDSDYEESCMDDILPASGTGWWRIATGDARFATQTVCKVWLSGSFQNQTLSGLYAMHLARGGTAPNMAQSVYHSSNTGFLPFVGFVGNLVRDYAVTESLYNPLRSYFPKMNCGNYQNTAHVSGVAYDDFNLASAYTNSTGFVKVTDSDHQAPALYGPQMNTGRFDVTTSFGSGYNEIWRNYNMRLIDSCTLSNVPVIPWIVPSGSSTQNGVNFTPTQIDSESVWNYAAYKGITHFKWFYSSGSENYDKIYDHIKYISSRVRYYNNIKNVVLAEGSGVISIFGGGGGSPEV
jgi:hypothetical protein